ncbi:hypothetical protein [Candidatus Enterovibrio altilux]|uniref:Mobile element protein n=1 Tax=Candidatus Enterovibrio altilux TaxID=1927128 RepID=A0A291B951_9GAMM|nr:Mobile element protein [Candidatus Enterovibrio luxaltus]
MFRVKKLPGGALSLRNHNAQIGKTCVMIKELNRLTGLDISNTKVII